MVLPEQPWPRRCTLMLLTALIFWRLLTKSRKLEYRCFSCAGVSGDEQAAITTSISVDGIFSNSAASNLNDISFSAYRNMLSSPFEFKITSTGSQLDPFRIVQTLLSAFRMHSMTSRLCFFFIARCNMVSCSLSGRPQRLGPLPTLDGGFNTTL